MHAKPDMVRIRRLKRQLKAAASIGIALAAGVFLACQRSVTDKTHDAEAPDGAEAAKPVVDIALDASGEDAARDGARTEGADASSQRDATAELDAGKPDALAKRPAARDASTVDKREHRKGMPVPDNLLE